MSQVRQILPQQILPARYEVSFEPNLETFRFTGVLKLHAQVREATNRLQLNAEELEIEVCREQRATRGARLSFFFSR